MQAQSGASAAPTPQPVAARARGRKVRVAVEGCAHGRLTDIYNAVSKRGAVDLLLICGDFQAVRNPGDLACMSVPDKYKEMGEFYKYYTGELRAPVLTLVIGGNHEASNYMQELFYGGWLAPNIYYLGQAGVVRVGGLRIAGMSGIFNERHYMQDLRRQERPPYTPAGKRSVYHIRPFEVAQLSFLTGRLDVFLSHDWPLGIAHFGNTGKLLSEKKFLRKEVMSNTLGSPPGAMLLNLLRPVRWFSAHMHVRFAALVRHAPPPPAPGNVANTAVSQSMPSSSTTMDSSASDGFVPAEDVGGDDTVVLKPQSVQGAGLPDTTEFLALDKCLPGRKYLEIVELEAPEAEPEGPLDLAYDPEWLAIMELTQMQVAPPPRRAAMNWEELRGVVEGRRAELTKKWAERDLVIDPAWFERTVTAYDPTQEEQRRHFRRARAPLQMGNPQTDRFLDTLGLGHRWPVTIAWKKQGTNSTAQAASSSHGGGVSASSSASLAAVTDENEIDIGL
ncbi:Lariat debranching enzyme [Hondaea fermentalgiana]|uniref:Lariat debranching enzyme n=1 Tax=Hondaea fermentalgiana TaxID=2315210 RepID=A0A2R5GGM4_9STRA|nr:Lariat debranching enzyme [Hondaea fermentalgiana]|eukprot:GBG29489.1 Lariat debranching enzyme [Hondaea fermentalgiana]